MKHTFTPKGVCSTRIDFELDGNLLRNVSFEDGCSGNLQGLARLVEGRTAAEVATILAGVKCGSKKSSCPDQLAKALKQALKKKKT